MKYSILFFLFNILLFACNNEKENAQQEKEKSCEAKHKTQNYTTTSLEISSKEKQYFFSIDFVYENAKNIHYYGFNPSSSSIEVIDIEQKKYIYSIPISKSGPNQIVNLTDFFVQSPDSIFVHTGFLKRLYLINQKGEIIQKWKIDKDLPDGTSANGGYYLAASPSSGVRFYYISARKSLLFHCEYLFFKNPFDKVFYQKPILVEYSLKDTSFYHLQGTYPKEYLQDGYSSFNKQFPFVITNSGDIFLGFTKSHQIHQYNQGKEQKHCAKSLYTKDKFTFLPQASKPEKYQQDYSVNAHYVGLFYDKVKDRMYRIVKHEQPPKNQEGLLNKYQNAAFSILVMDSKGNVMGETKPLPNNIYNFANIYPTKKGILISKESKFNISNKEEYLEFDWINLNF